MSGYLCETRRSLLHTPNDPNCSKLAKLLYLPGEGGGYVRRHSGFTFVGESDAHSPLNTTLTYKQPHNQHNLDAYSRNEQEHKWVV